VIEGEVTPERQGVIRLRVSHPGGSSEEISAAIDTGFTGFLALPTDTIARWGLHLVGARRGRLADGSLILMPLYLAHVLWDGVLRRVQVLETGGPCLVGVSLLYGYVLTFEAIEGGHISIEKLPQTH
jgi:clan AA aspartic protease